MSARTWRVKYDHSPHWHWGLKFWRLAFHVELWSNRYPLHTSRLCARFQMHYDRKHGKGYAQ